jgi:hypothetical protein
LASQTPSPRAITAGIWREPLDSAAPRPYAEATERKAPAMVKRSKPRQTYEPPRIRKVKLVPDELAVTGCKAVMVGVNVCRIGGRFVNFSKGS